MSLLLTLFSPSNDENSIIAELVYAKDFTHVS